MRMDTKTAQINTFLLLMYAKGGGASKVYELNMTPKEYV